MTSIEYGGGPTIEQRRKFANPPPGTHIPGLTTLMAEHLRLPYYNGAKDTDVVHLKPRIKEEYIGKGRSVFADELPHGYLPKAKGDNKLIENLMPGYSGDLPKVLFKFGRNYTQTANEGINEFIQSYVEHENDLKETHALSGVFPKLKPVLNDNHVRDNLNIWVDDLTKKNALPPRKTLLEPALPGYTGYVPRSNVSEVSLGHRFSQGTQRSAQAFEQENRDHFDNLAQPAIPPAQNTNIKGIEVQPPNAQVVPSRLYHQNGCVPSYTGHVHRYRYDHGLTYGESTRNMESCQHHYPSYGAYLKAKPHLPVAQEEQCPK